MNGNTTILIIIGIIVFLLIVSVSVFFVMNKTQTDDLNMPTAKNINEALEMQQNDAVIAISQILWDKVKARSFNSLTDAEKNFFAVDYLISEVNNGGFDQYFFNSSGEYANEALLGLKKIGAIKTASIVQNSFSIFPEHKVPKDRQERWKLMGKDKEKNQRILEELDDKFYEYPEDLTDLLFKYAEKNKNEFK